MAGQPSAWARSGALADNLDAGDARATDMGRSGELSLGQLVRERWSRDAVLIGFTTYDGTVLAADEWGGAPREMAVPAALPRSYEAILHDVEEPRVLLFTAEADAALPARRAERVIGPVVRPGESDPQVYFEATIARQYDAVLHIDRTSATTPLD
jgi:erythromycin esterase-like protein